MKKYIITLGLALSLAGGVANACQYGVGLESNVSMAGGAIESELGQLQRSLRVPALGIKCGRLSASTNDLSGLNSGHDVLTERGAVRVRAGRWSVGYNVLERNVSGRQYGVGVSLSRIKKEVAGADIERYYQPHLTFSAVDKESRLGLFASLGERKSVKSFVFGVYYVFGD